MSMPICGEKSLRRMEMTVGTKLRDFVEKKMTPAELANAQKLARECVRKNYKGC